ncbi:MAG: methyltransferase [Pseudomonadota bacterium]
MATDAPHVDEWDRTGSSVDSFLGGRVYLVQPRKGFRCGSDAIVLASLLPKSLTGALVDLGAGPGGVGFAAAARCPGLSVWCVDRDCDALAHARASLTLVENAGFASRVTVVEGDVADPPAHWSVTVPRATAVLMNPPYFAADACRHSPDAARDKARALGADGLAPWLLAARRVLCHGGLLGVIAPASRLGELVGLAGFGATKVFPIHSHAGEPALRVVVATRLGRRAALRVMPALVMHDGDGRFSRGAAHILAGEATLEEAVRCHPPKTHPWGIEAL